MFTRKKSERELQSLITDSENGSQVQPPTPTPQNKKNSNNELFKIDLEFCVFSTLVSGHIKSIEYGWGNQRSSHYNSYRLYVF